MDVAEFSITRVILPVTSKIAPASIRLSFTDPVPCYCNIHIHCRPIKYAFLGPTVLDIYNTLYISFEPAMGYLTVSVQL